MKTYSEKVFALSFCSKMMESNNRLKITMSIFKTEKQRFALQQTLKRKDCRKITLIATHKCMEAIQTSTATPARLTLAHQLIVAKNKATITTEVYLNWREKPSCKNFISRIDSTNLSQSTRSKLQMISITLNWTWACTNNDSNSNFNSNPNNNIINTSNKTYELWVTHRDVSSNITIKWRELE